MTFSLLLLALASQTSKPDTWNDLVLRLSGELEAVEVLELTDRGFEYHSLEEWPSQQRFLSWKSLFPGEQEWLESRTGASLMLDMEFADAHEYRYQVGERTETVVGYLAEEYGDNLRVHHRGSTSLVPQRLLLGEPAKIQVPVTSLFDVTEFRQRIPESTTTNGANLPQRAATLFLFGELELARGELIASAGAAPTEDARAGLDSRIASLSKARELALALADATDLAREDRFAEALELTTQLLSRALLAADVRTLIEEEVARLESGKAKALGKLVAYEWHEELNSILKTKATPTTRTLSALVDEVRRDVPGLVRARLLERAKAIDLELTIADIEDAWANRRKHNSRTYRATFGTGTWTTVPDLGTPPGADTSHLVTPEEWWNASTTKTSTRLQYLLAHYAQAAGDFEVTRVLDQACGTCGGTGVVKNLAIGARRSRRSSAICPTCHYFGKTHTVKFR